jgi:hypothetical protein
MFLSDVAKDTTVFVLSFKIMKTNREQPHFLLVMIYNRSNVVSFSMLTICDKTMKLVASVLLGFALPNSAQAYFSYPGPGVIKTPVNLDDVITITYSYGFNHGDPPRSSNSWKYLMNLGLDVIHDGTPLPGDPNLIEVFGELSIHEGDLSNVNGPFLHHVALDATHHGSLAVFFIQAGLNKVRTPQGDYQRQFAIKYLTPEIKPLCADDKPTCGALIADLQVNILVNGKPSIPGFGDGVYSASQSHEVPSPLPILGACAASVYNRKLRKLRMRHQPTSLSTNRISAPATIQTARVNHT